MHLTGNAILNLSNNGGYWIREAGLHSSKYNFIETLQIHIKIVTLGEFHPPLSFDICCRKVYKQNGCRNSAKRHKIYPQIVTEKFIQYLKNT